MKTKLLICFLALFLIENVKAQNLPNASFDSVYFGGIDRLFDWITADGFRMVTGTNWPDTVYALKPDSTYNGSGFMFHELLWMNNQSDTSSHSFASAIIINRPNWYKTNGDIFPGFLIAGNSLTTDALGYPDLSKCGIPFPHRPTKLQGLYHFVDSTVMLNNFGKCIILLKKWNATTHQSDTIAFAESGTELSPTFGFSPFEITLNYRSSNLPDTIMVAFFASTVLQNPAALWLDELSFSYVGIGLPEIDQSVITFYPNPTSDFLNIDAKPETTYQLYDVHGRLLKEGSAQSPIDLSALQPQWLFVKLYQGAAFLGAYKILKVP